MADEPRTVADVEARARERMPAMFYDYYAGGAGDERTLARNCEAFDRFSFLPRVLVDASHVDTATTVLGTPIALPVLLAPTAFNKLAHPDGELAAARAAGAAGTLMIASTISTHTMEEIAGAATGPLWFQLYVYKDRAVTQELVRRAEAAGYRALVLTVDTARLGRRLRDDRNRFALPPGVSIRNLETCQTVLTGAAGWTGESSFSRYIHDLFDPGLTWEAVDWLRSITRLPILVKGILDPADARRAAAAGVHGVIVSNHGGRQLDGAVPAIDALGPIVDAAGARVEVLMDGGIRRGTDVLTALALGARAVLIGRAYLWGLASDGEEGVRRVLEILRGDLELAMALAGRPKIADVDRALIVKRP